MRLMSLTAAMLAAASLSACAYQAVPDVSPAVNVYSTYDDKVDGKFLLTVDAGDSVMKRDVKASSHVCSAHMYPINAGGSVTQSVVRTMQNVFKEVEVVSTPPTADAMRASGTNGHIMVRIDDFNPRLSCQAGFMTGTCSSTVDLSVGVTVNSPQGKLLGTSVGATRSADSQGGGACEGGAVAISQATSNAIKEAMERLAERVTNAPKLREATGPARVPAVVPAAAPAASTVACKVNEITALVSSKADCLKAGGRVLQ